ncbi:hypothetical protein BGZ52_011523, partial [Haplosporangium bisporale]
DYGKALEWNLKASDASNADAMLIIGDRYRDGEGALKDRVEARGWYIKARGAGAAEATIRIKE